MNSAHGKYPLSSPDQSIVAAGLKGLETSLRNARLWASDAVLLVPGFVTPQVRYKECWERSQREIRRILPMAAEMKIVIAIENGGNRFLLSPLEFAQYVDEFNNPWLRAYFDVGNIVRNGFPQDWIRTLDKRIVKLHLKDPVARPAPGAPATPRAPLLEGDVDWREVHKALTEIGPRRSGAMRGSWPCWVSEKPGQPSRWTALKRLRRMAGSRCGSAAAGILCWCRSTRWRRR